MVEEVSAAHKITSREQWEAEYMGVNACLSAVVAVPFPPPSSASFNHFRPVQKRCIHQVDVLSSSITGAGESKLFADELNGSPEKADGCSQGGCPSSISTPGHSGAMMGFSPEFHVLHVWAARVSLSFTHDTSFLSGPILAVQVCCTTVGKLLLFYFYTAVGRRPEDFLMPLCKERAWVKSV